MPNRFCNLIGTNKIKDEYTKINDGFESVAGEIDTGNTRMNNHVAGTSEKHGTNSILNNSSNVDGNTLTNAIDSIDSRIDSHVAGTTERHGSNDIENQSSQVGANISAAINGIAGIVQNIQTGDSNSSIGVYALNATGTNTITSSYTGLTYYSGLKVWLTTAGVNTGSATFNINSLGAKTIKIKKNGVKVSLDGGEMPAVALLIYDGTDFLLINSDESYGRELNAVLTQQVAQHKRLLTDFEGEIGTVTLTNSDSYPFNNSQITRSLTKARDTVNYTVVAEIVSSVGVPGNIIVSDKAVNGFKIKFDGSATSVVVKYYVQGGMYQ